MAGGLISYFVAALAVICIGIEKAGFGGGLIAVPLFLLVLDPKEALGIILPLLCACDVLAVYFYRKDFDKRNILRLLPGALLGILIGSLLLGRVPDRQLKLWIGLLAMLFVIYHFSKSWLLEKITAYHPKGWHGPIFGILVGVTSTLAHAAGPVATMYLFPQRMSRVLFVGTNAVLFTFVNAVKLIPYILLGMISWKGITFSLTLAPLLPVGVWLGVWMNRRMSEKVFGAFIYAITFLLGLQLAIGFNLISALSSLF
jgi:uncharacterized membrane protein YfcA